ncbi:MAG: hypothetical protein ABSG49_01975 [Methanoregula sp.]|jgi:hypothetical protein|uniref:hypothetical protein n=1 Tax=Methanoregula sp. TaxID=2052170 RepID=UPI003C1F69C0
MGVTDIIIATAAFWGAILSTIVFVSQILEHRTKIRVEYQNYLDEDETGFVREFYLIRAINERNKPVTMSHAYIEQYPPIKVGILPTVARTTWDTSIDGKQIFKEQRVQAEFEYPKDFKLIIPPENRGEKKQVIGVFVDQAGNIYKSDKPFMVG